MLWKYICSQVKQKRYSILSCEFLLGGRQQCFVTAVCIVRSVAVSSQQKHSEAAEEDVAATLKKATLAEPAAINTEPAVHTAPDTFPAAAAVSPST